MKNDYSLLLYTVKKAVLIDRIINSNFEGVRIIVRDLGENYKEIIIPEGISLYAVYEPLFRAGIVGEFANVIITDTKVVNEGDNPLLRVKTNIRYSYDELIKASVLS